MRWRLLLVLCIVWLLVPASARASCVYLGPLCQTWKSNAAIFDGTVRSIERLDRNEEMRPGKVERIGHRLVTFDVHEVWLGEVGSQVQLVLWGGTWPEGGWQRSTELDVTVGTRYVIFAGRNERGELHASSCSGSRKYEDAAEALSFLRSLRMPSAGGRVFGTVTHDVPYLIPDQAPRRGIITEVRLTGGAVEQSVTTTAGKGAFEFRGLPPGDYSLHVALPSGLVWRNPPPRVSVESATACRHVDVRLDHATSIAGILVDASGRPLPEILVDVARSDSWKEAAPLSISTHTGPDGRFEFTGLPPGEYILALNLRDAGYRKEPRTFYATTSEEPEVIRLGGASHVWLGEWRVKFSR